MQPPRSQSIFLLGEEGGHERHHGHAHADLGADHRQARERLVGLQILIQQHNRRAHASNIVFRQSVRPLASPRHAGHRVSCFLKACFLCHRELSPNKDVYMYRGDQGFCSEECRWQQILLDEARTSPSHHHRPHSPIRSSRPRRILAVA